MPGNLADGFIEKEFKVSSLKFKVEEKIIYITFIADETLHFNRITNFLSCVLILVS